MQDENKQETLEQEEKETTDEVSGTGLCQRGASGIGFLRAGARCQGG